MVVLAAGCGDDDTPPITAPSGAPSSPSAANASTPTPSPAAASTPATNTRQSPLAPAEMCPDAAWPMIAAFELETGDLRWVTCEPGGGLFLMAAASEDTVWVRGGGAQTGFFALDADSGDELWRGDEARFRSELPDDADLPVESPPLIDGVQLSGGQDDPVTGVNGATNEMLWTHPGLLVYDDVWAVGDGAVFAVEPPALVAYEVATGEVRWRRDLSAYLWPWHVTGERLLVMWNNLQVVDTDDGSVLWETRYPEPPTGFPRMMGGLANSQSVFVSFTSETSGGD